MEKVSAGKFRTKEQWRVIRAMVEEEGMTLLAVSKKTGIAYSTIQGRARIECWNPPAGIIRGRPRDTEILAAQARKIEEKLAREEALLVAETALVKAEELEVPARKCLVADSARAKVMVSRLVKGLLSRLEDPTIPPRSAAQALGALVPVLRLLYKWQEEPSEAELKAANNPNHAINIALISTSPEQMRMVGQRGKGPSPEMEREHVPGAENEKQIQKKEASRSTAKEQEPQERRASSMPARSEEDNQASSCIGRPSFIALPVEQPVVQGNPPIAPGDGPSLFGRPPGVEAQIRQQREERTRQRTEWRRGR
jgi:hypothetical protein